MLTLPPSRPQSSNWSPEPTGGVAAGYPRTSPSVMVPTAVRNSPPCPSRLGKRKQSPSAGASTPASLLSATGPIDRSDHRRNGMGIHPPKDRVAPARTAGHAPLPITHPRRAPGLAKPRKATPRQASGRHHDLDRQGFSAFFNHEIRLLAIRGVPGRSRSRGSGLYERSQHASAGRMPSLAHVLTSIHELPPGNLVISRLQSSLQIVDANPGHRAAGRSGSIIPRVRRPASVPTASANSPQKGPARGEIRVRCW